MLMKIKYIQKCCAQKVSFIRYNINKKANGTDYINRHGEKKKILIFGPIQIKFLEGERAYIDLWF